VIRSIRLTKRYQKQFGAMTRAGGVSLLAARKAAAITQVILGSGNDVKSKRTQHGEQRIKGCLKYDLGNGFRLIGSRQGHRIFLLYIGTHEECDRWISRRRDFGPLVLEAEGQELPAPDGEERQDTPADVTDMDDDYDRLLLQQVDDRYLRRLFRGLCRRGQQCLTP